MTQQRGHFYQSMMARKALKSHKGIHFQSHLDTCKNMQHTELRKIRTFVICLGLVLARPYQPYLRAVL